MYVPYLVLFCYFLKTLSLYYCPSALWDWILSGLSPCFRLCHIPSPLLPPWFQSSPSLPPQPLAGPQARCPSRDELCVTEYIQISVLDRSSATDLPCCGHLRLSYVSTMPRILPSVSPRAFRSPAPKARLCLLWCVSNILSHFLLMTLDLLQASISLQLDSFCIYPFSLSCSVPFLHTNFPCVCLSLLTLYVVSSRFLRGSFQNSVITLTLSVTLSSEWISPIPQRVNLSLPLSPAILP